jgi:hypothetical protein
MSGTGVHDMSDATDGERSATGGVGAESNVELGPTGSVGQKARTIESAAIAGIGYAVIGTIALQLLESFPDLDQTDAQLNEWFADSSNQTTLIVGANLVAISSILFLWFVAVIRRRLGDRDDRFFGTVFLGSAVTYVAVWLGHAAAVASPAVAMTYLEGASVTGSSATNAAGLGSAFLLLLAPRIQAVFVIVTSTLILRSKVLPRWLAIIGYVIAVGMLLIPLIIDPIRLGFPSWVFLVSVVILLSRPRARARKMDPEGQGTG